MPTERAHCRIGDHREAWEAILPGLETLYAQEETQDWSIEGVRDMLDEERALLMIDEDDPTAFAVLRLNEYLYDPSQLELFVLLAYHQGGNAIERFQPYMELAARAAGAKHLRFYSRRPGMLKVAMSVGYRARSVEYVKEI